MKKILSLILVSLLAVCSLGVITATAATTQSSPAPLAAEEQGKLYLVPGTYVEGGQTVENEVPTGATKLSAAECEAIFTQNAYLCTVERGAKLPVPISTRKDKEGNPYCFNGWWTIKNATVTYYKSMPKVTEPTFFYADWRADLSQHKDPIIPDGVVAAEPNHYLELKHADGTTENVKLIRGFTNISSAENLGYQFAAELKVEGLELKPGDSFVVYTTGLKESDKAEKSPIGGSNKQWSIDLEASTEKENDTKDFLSAPESAYYLAEPRIEYIGEEAGQYNLYIKYFSGGSIMAVYMEPMGLV
ncbi:MAG: hypothetical protein HFE46_00905 [Clostridia bacterium]|jgi:hypothetical protein|nr:hypothetical protein [Clostridia bacterium]